MNFLSTLLLAIVLPVTYLTDKPEIKLYDEIYRPQFHFTPKKNWHNNPSGLLFLEEEYHMFYQDNPKNKERDSSHWAHTTSNDLLHWKQQPIALYHDENSENKERCTAFSGSVILDAHNLLGKQLGITKTLVAFYTGQDCGQRITYSTDKGQSWKNLEGNPIIPYDETDEARDPKVIWHKASQKWVMVLSRKISKNEDSKGISIYTSDNLVDWKWESHVPGLYECPDLVEFQVTNRPDESKWVLFGGNGSYLLGDFDGKNFTSETGKTKSDWGKNFYSAQTWSNISKENGRTIQIAWMRGGSFPDMPFNGQMSFPCELSVTKFPTGYKLIRKPIAELNQLHGKSYSWEDKNLIPGINENKLKKVSGDCLHIIGEFDIKSSDNFGLMLRHSSKEAGTEILYNVKRGTLSVLGCTVPLPAENNKIKLEILLDRTSIEIFANDGQKVISNCFTPAKKAMDVLLFTNGGELGIDKIDVYKIESVWNQE